MNPELFNSPEFYQQLADGIQRGISIQPYPNAPKTSGFTDIILKLSLLYAQLNEPHEQGSTLKLINSLLSHDNALKAYTLYYMPVNCVKFADLFLEVINFGSQLKETLKENTISFLDIGCGPGTASLAFSIIFPELAKRTTFFLIDQNRKFLEIASNMLSPYKTRIIPSDAKINFFKELPSDRNGVFLVAFSNMLVENQNFSFLEHLQDRLLRDLTRYILFCLEPGTKIASRNLLKERDTIKEKINIIYPCTHNSCCPALAENGNWCHLKLHWERPEWIRIIDKNTGFDKSELEYSPLILSNFLKNSEVSKKSRIVSDLKTVQKNQEFFICNEKGLFKNKLPKKLAKSLKRGDLI